MRALRWIALVQRSQWWDLMWDQTASPPHCLLALCFGSSPPRQGPQGSLELVPKHSLKSCTIKRLQFLKPGRSSLFLWQLEKGRGRSVKKKVGPQLQAERSVDLEEGGLVLTTVLLDPREQQQPGHFIPEQRWLCNSQDERLARQLEPSWGDSRTVM